MSRPRPSIVPQFAVALVLAVAFALLYGIAAGWLDGIREQLLIGDAAYGWYETLGTDTKGNVLIGSFKRTKYEYRTLDGESTSREIAVHPAYLTGQDLKPSVPIVADWDQRIWPFVDDDNPPTYWYFVATDISRQGKGHFIGYNAADRSLVGYISNKGFATTPPSYEDEFPIDGAFLHLSVLKSQFTEAGYSPGELDKNALSFPYPPWIAFLFTDGRLLRVDLKEKQMSSVLDANDIISVSQSMQQRAETDERAVSLYQMWKTTYLLRRTDRVTIFDPIDGKTVDFVLPDEVRRGTFSFFPLPGDKALIDITHTNLESISDSHDLIWFNRAGEVTERRTISLRARKRVPSMRETAFVVATIVPTPVVAGLIPFGNALSEKPEPIQRIVAEGWPAFAMLLLLSTTLAFVVDRRQQRYRLPRSYGWLAFVFLLGLPGFVGYLLHRRWPVRQQAQVPVKTGLEVFA